MRASPGRIVDRFRIRTSEQNRHLSSDRAEIDADGLDACLVSSSRYPMMRSPQWKFLLRISGQTLSRYPVTLFSPAPEQRLQRPGLHQTNQRCLSCRPICRRWTQLSMWLQLQSTEVLLPESDYQQVWPQIERLLWPRLNFRWVMNLLPAAPFEVCPLPARCIPLRTPVAEGRDLPASSTFRLFGTYTERRLVRSGPDVYGHTLGNASTGERRI